MAKFIARPALLRRYLLRSTQQSNFAITNNGEVPVSIEDVTIIDDASGSFSINNLSSITNAGPLEPEQSLNVSLTFQPKASEVAWQELTAKLKFTLEVQEEYPDAAQPVIELMGRTQQRPEVTVSILSHDFGDVLLGESVTQDLQITNVGLGRLELPQTCFVDNNSTCLNTPTSSGAYSWTGTLPSHLGPGEATSLSVTYSPSEAAAGAPQETATLLIETNDGANPNVPNDIDEQALEVTLTARAVNPDSALSMEAFPLTLVYSTTWVYRNLTITNEGTGTLTVSDITVDDPSVGAGEDNEFTVDLPSVLTIAEGSDLTVPIGFRPTGSGERAATLVISFDGLPDKTRAINGQGVYGALAPTTHVFPKTWVGDSSDATLTLVNSTGVALPISSVALAGAHESNYAIVDVAYETGNTADGVLDNGKSLLVDLRFEPKEASIAGSTEVTLNLAELQVTLNVADAYPGANNPLITDLSGAAQKKPSLAIYEADGSTVLLASGTSSAQADLGNVVVGQTGSFTFRVKNEGAGQLELPTACFSQAGCNVPNHEDGSFSFSPSAQGTPAFPDALEPGGYVDVTVSFSPTETVASPVTQTATWALQTNDPDATEQEIELVFSGTVIDPQPTLAWTDFGNELVYQQSAASSLLRIQNSNAGPLQISAVTLEGDEDFSVSLGDLSVIPSGGHRDATVSFLPVLNGERTAVVTVSFEGGVDSVSTTVSGTGSYGSVTGTNTDFGFLYRNESLTQTVTLTNDAADEAFPLVDLPITTLSISSSSCNFVLIDDSSGSDEEVASLEINDALAVGGTLDFKTKFNPTASAPSTVNCTASVSVGLAVQNDFPIGQNHTLSLSGSVRNEPLAKLQVQNSDGSWSQMNGFDFGNVYNNDDAGDDATVSMRIINEDAAGYGGDLTVSKLCFKETGSSTECTADPAAGAFDVVSRITDDVVLAAGESHGFTLQFNPDWSNSSGETAHARDLRYETDDPVLGSGNHEIAGNTVRPKLWANVTAAGGGPIDAQAFIDYDQRATAANFSAVDVWGAPRRTFICIISVARFRARSPTARMEHGAT